MHYNESRKPGVGLRLSLYELTGIWLNGWAGMYRYLMFGILLVVFLTALVFASVNTDPVTLDLAFTEVDTTTSLAMLAFFAAGWFFGLVCIALYLLKMLAERRQLRKSLRLAEAEVTSLRRMPMQDAD